jgi:hypothetical protein
MAWVSSSGTQTPSSCPAGEEFRQRSGVEAVGLRPRGADPGVGGRDRDQLGDVGADDPRRLPGVARYLERHLVVSAEAPGKELQRLGGHLDPPRRADLAALGDRDLGEVTVDIETDRSHLLTSWLSLVLEGRWTTTATYPCSEHNRAGRRGGH